MNKKYAIKRNLIKINKKPFLYLISPEKFKLIEFSVQIEKILSTNTIDIFQLRTKKINEKQLIRCIKKLFPLCKKNNVLFMNV